ncbi:MAG: hypothetical protein KGI80_03880 [Verrucomicrobiota bacterium]|nr:hypothetical protein [Verrucomicrobiota bacterium]
MKNKSPHVATVVNFCTNELCFLRPCLEQASLFSNEVVVVVASHFFDGTPENRLLLDQIYRAFPAVLFVEYPFLPSAIPSKVFKQVRKENFWHSLSRWIGFSHLSKEIQWVLFLDADEVAEGERFSSWLRSSSLSSPAAFKLANYWYFREPVYRATTLEDSCLLVSKEDVLKDFVLHSDERDALYRHFRQRTRGVTGADGIPFFHHFSWVRTEKEMLRKVRAWGHKGDRDWEALVRKEWSAPFSGTDFVHNYRFQKVPAPFLLDGLLPPPQGNGGNVLFLEKKELLSFL